MSNTTRHIHGTEKMVMELQANLFNRINTVTEDGEQVYAHEVNGGKEDGYCLKVDLGYYTEPQLRLIETAINARISAGVLDASAWPVNEELVKNSFALTADSPEKLEIIMNDILRGAKVSEDKIQVLNQPFAPGMYSTYTIVVIAFDLTEDQIKAVQLASKVARQGIKVQNFAKKAGMIATSTANVTNRVGREVLLAGTEVGITLGAGAVKTAVEMTACAVNIGIRDLNPKELMQGTNVQQLSNTIRSLWKKDNSSSKITNGFAAL